MKGAAKCFLSDQPRILKVLSCKYPPRNGRLGRQGCFWIWAIGWAEGRAGTGGWRGGGGGWGVVPDSSAGAVLVDGGVGGCGGSRMGVKGQVGEGGGGGRRGRRAKVVILGHEGGSSIRAERSEVERVDNMWRP